jgi:hypothetical protein
MQQNETIKMTYLPNMIRIPTNGIDWWHHGFQIEERKLKSLMESSQDEERKRKKEKRKEEKEGLRDCWQASHANSFDVTGITPCQIARLIGVTQPTWHKG